MTIFKELDDNKRNMIKKLKKCERYSIIRNRVESGNYMKLRNILLILIISIVLINIIVPNVEAHSTGEVISEAEGFIQEGINSRKTYY